MLFSLYNLLVLLAGLGSGLIAGTFFAFSAFVMGALARLPPANGTAAMQSINVVVLNPWFMTVFLGMVGLSLVLGVWALLRLSAAGSVWVLAGAVLYLVSFGITMAFNVPLNDGLAAADAASPGTAALWSDYVRDWTSWNTLRTLADLAATAAFMLGLAAARAVQAG